MTTNIGTTINVGFNTDGSQQYSPNSQFQVPADTVETVIWAGTGTLKFVKNSGQVSKAGTSTVQISYGGAGTYADNVTTRFDNTGGSAFTPTVSFRVVDTSSTVQPPVQIDGGSTIRNKGTSIWVWELIFTFAALLAGFVIGYAANTLNASGSPSPLLFGVAGLVLGFGFGYMYSKGGFKRLG